MADQIQVNPSAVTRQALTLYILSDMVKAALKQMGSTSDVDASTITTTAHDTLREGILAKSKTANLNQGA